MTSKAMIDLADLVRERFTAADGVVYARVDDDAETLILWQVVAGHDVIWDAGPAVQEQIPRWDKLVDAVRLLAATVSGRPERGDWLTLRLRPEAADGRTEQEAL